MPHATTFLLAVPWLPVAGSLLALIAGAIATVHPGRRRLVLAAASLLIAVAAVLFAHTALEWSFVYLRQSIAGF